MFCSKMAVGLGIAVLLVWNIVVFGMHVAVAWSTGYWPNLIPGTLDVAAFALLVALMRDQHWFSRVRALLAGLVAGPASADHRRG